MSFANFANIASWLGEFRIPSMPPAAFSIKLRVVLRCDDEVVFDLPGEL